MSTPPDETSRHRFSIALRIVLLYMISGILWILAGDLVLDKLVETGPDKFLIGLTKGISYVLVTGLLLQMLISRALTSISHLERETAQKEDLFRAVFDNAPEAILLLDSEGRVLRVNKTAHQWLEPPNAQIEGVLYSDLIQLGHMAGTRQTPAELLDGREEVRGDLVGVSVGDGQRDFRYTIRANVAPGHQLVMLSDVTDRNAAERELRMSERNARTLMEQASDGILISGPDGFFVDANTHICDLLGYTREELSRLRPSDVAAQDIKEDELASIEALRRGTTLLRETTMRRKDGSVFPVEISLKMLDDGRLLGIVRDMTERKAREAALRLSEERFRTQYKGIPVPTYTWQHIDNDFILINYNDEGEKISNGQVRRLLGSRASTLYADHPYMQECMRLCASEKTTVQREGPYRMLSTGVEFYFSMTFVYVPPDLIMVHTEDISERIKHEKATRGHVARQTQLLTQLLTAQETERRRLSMDIHDGPLQSLGVSLLAIDRAVRRSEMGQFDIVVQELHGLREVLGGTVRELRAVLADLRMDVLGEQGLVPALRTHIELFSEITGLNVFFSTNLEGRLPQYIEVVMYRLVQEALSNVRKHSGATQVNIFLRMQSNVLHLEIRDNGKGFDPNSVLQVTRAGERIGLRSMRQRIEDAAGSMTLETAHGNGTTLLFSCPLLD